MAARIVGRQGIPRVAIFIDWPNIFYGHLLPKNLKMHVDFITRDILESIARNPEELNLFDIMQTRSLSTDQIRQTLKIITKQVFFDVEHGRNGSNKVLGPNRLEDVQTSYLHDFLDNDWTVRYIEKKGDTEFRQSRSRSSTDVAMGQRIIDVMHRQKPNIIVMVTGDSDFKSTFKIVEEYNENVILDFKRDALSQGWDKGEIENALQDTEWIKENLPKDYADEVLKLHGSMRTFVPHRMVNTMVVSFPFATAEVLKEGADVFAPLGVYSNCIQSAPKGMYPEKSTGFTPQNKQQLQRV